MCQRYYTVHDRYDMHISTYHSGKQANLNICGKQTKMEDLDGFSSSEQDTMSEGLPQQVTRTMPKSKDLLEFDPDRADFLEPRDILNQQTQQLIDDINTKRKRDTTLLADFKKSMELQASNSYDSLEQAMYQLYEKNGKLIQDKLQELFTTLDRISKLEMELDQFKHSLRALYSDIHGPSSQPT